MSVARFLSAAKKLPFDERFELAYCLWDEFNAGLKDWNVTPMPEGLFAWKTLKAEIDANLSRDDRLELAQGVWSNIVDNGYEPELTPEQIEELERRGAELRRNPESGIPWEQVRAELKERLKGRSCPVE
jgi:putative addiction module component (TIGR02574 family)